MKLSSKEIKKMRKMQRQAKWILPIMYFFSFFMLAAAIFQYFSLVRLCHAVELSMIEMWRFALTTPKLDAKFLGVEVLAASWIGNILLYLGGFVLMLLIVNLHRKNFKRDKILLKYIDGDT